MIYLCLALLGSIGLFQPAFAQSLPALEQQLAATSTQLTEIQAKLASQSKQLGGVRHDIRQASIMLLKTQQYPAAFWPAWAITQQGGAGLPLVAWVARHQTRKLGQLQQRYQALFALYQQASTTQQKLLMLQEKIAATEGRLNRSQRAELAAAGIQASALAQRLAAALEVALPSPTTPQPSLDVVPTQAAAPAPKSAVNQRVATNRLPANGWPVAGKLKLAYKQGTGATSEGVVLAAPAGSHVVSPLAGRVLFAGAFRQFGGLVIIEGPDGHDELLGGLGVLAVEADQQIKQGQLVGELGGRGLLYWEIRVRGQARNPLTFKR